MILTGGYNTPYTVSEYSESGFTRSLPELQQGRYDHGCSYFENEEGSLVDINSISCGVIFFQTFLVTGGINEYIDGGFLSSTELLKMNAASWTYSGELPSPSGLRGANIDKRVIMTGNKFIK